jgi:KDO2-lipid IV(A) lauroyltransferase
MVGLLLYKLGALLVHVLPESITKKTAAFMAYLNYCFRSRSRRNVQQNIRLMIGPDHPEQAIRSISRKVFVNFAESIRLFLGLPYIDPETLDSQCDLSGLDDIVSRIEPGRGFVIVSAHIGPWELGGAFLSTRGFKISTVALDHPSGRVTRFYNRRRSASAIEVFPVGRSFHRLEEAVGKGECVVLFIDRAHGRMRDEFEFFGIKRIMPTGHLHLAYRMKVPVLVGAFLFDGDGKYKGLIKGPYEIDDTLPEEDAMKKLQQRCLHDLEEMIAAHPDQYFYFRSLASDDA